MASVTADRRTTRGDHALETIRGWIIEGRLPPGQPLVESALARELEVSRVPVREALQRLSEQGFVELHPGQSAQVARRSGRDIIEMFEVREVLEGLICSSAARRAGVEDIELLRACLEEGRGAVTSAAWDVVRDSNARFHLMLANMSRNHHLVEVIEGYRYRLAWLHGASAQQRGMAAWDEHEEIIAVVAAGDADRAEELGRRHVAASREAFTRAYLEG